MTKIRQKLGTVDEIIIKTLPVKYGRTGSKKAGIYLIVFSLVFGGMPVAGLLYLLSERNFEMMMLAAVVPFVLIGIAVFINGMNQLYMVEDISIDRDMVSFNSRSLFRKKSWSEPLASFNGVLLKNEHRSRAYCHVISLDHDKPGIDLELAAYHITWMPESDVRNRWEHYCRVLNLPALEMTSEGIRKRSVEELDSPVMGGSDGEDIISAAGLMGNVPDDITVTNEKGSDVLVFKRRKAIIPSAIGIVIFSALLMLIASASFNNPGPGTVLLFLFGLAMGGYAIGYAIWYLASRQCITVETGRIIINHRTIAGNTKGKTIDLYKIEEIKVDKDPYGKYKSVHIITSSKIIKSGSGLADESLQWVKDFLLSRIKKAR